MSGTEEGHGGPKYSVCLTNYNTIKTLESSLGSILQQLDSRFEVVVVDNLSSDGSVELLRRLERSGKIRLIEQKCNRGRGRQLAFEDSAGEYIIDQVDLDDYYKPCMTRLVEFYHKNFEGVMMMTNGFLIAPRGLLQELGGWRSLQWGEDRDLWDRAASIDKLVYVPYESRTYIKPHGSGSFLHRVKYKYERARDLYVLGRSPSDGTHFRLSNFPIDAMAYLRSRFMKRYPAAVRRFNKVDHAARGVVFADA
ncbi:MAG: glycosyltransferase family 2 protein [Thaumarchaeota archaeon]|nr:glycosyltransferase family 2 protein [Nitrososphaerota archaeon]